MKAVREHILKNENPALLTYYLTKVPDINVPAHGELPPLLYACALGRHEMVGHLLAYGATDVQYLTPSGRTALQLACKSGSEPTVRLLLTHGVTVPQGGLCPLVQSVQDEQVEMLCLLLEHGALRQDHGDAALRAAYHLRRKACLKKLFEAGAEMSTSFLEIACSHGHHDLTLLCLANTATFPPQGDALHLACTVVAPSMPVLHSLIRVHGVDVNALSAKGRTALNMAREHGNMKAADMLVSSGAVERDEGFFQWFLF